MRVFCPNTLKKRERDDIIRYTIGRDAFFVLRDDDDDDDAKRRPPPRFFCPSSIVVIDFFLGRDDEQAIAPSDDMLNGAVNLCVQFKDGLEKGNYKNFDFDTLANTKQWAVKSPTGIARTRFL